MKKISKSILRFIKGFIKFFDKWLITPITKLCVGVYDFFSNKGSGIEKILVNRQSLVIISLIFALLMTF